MEPEAGGGACSFSRLLSTIFLSESPFSPSMASLFLLLMLPLS